MKPFDEIRKIQEELDKMLSRISGKDEEKKPSADIWETKNTVVIHVLLPGVRKKDVHVSTGSSGVDVTVTDDDKPMYHRHIPLPSYANLSGAGATFENDMLEITVPKEAEA